MRDPLNQFAERIIRNNEVAELIRGLLDKGVAPELILNEVAKFIRGLLDKGVAPEMIIAVVRDALEAKNLRRSS